MGDVVEFLLDPIGTPIANAIGFNSPVDYAFSMPWDYPDMWAEDWRAFKHLLIPDMRQDREVNTNASLNSRRVIYGRARVGIQLAYAVTTGDQNQYLHVIGIFCGHPITSFNKIWLDDNLITDSRYSGLVSYELFDGTQTTACASMMTASGGQWTADHKLSGCAYIYACFTYSESAFPAGVPAIKATISGRGCYDPRTLTTAWSDNPALCARDYMLLENKYGGMGCALTEVDDASIIVAANYCDQMVVTPATTRTAYNAAISYTTGQVVIGTDGLVYQAITDVSPGTAPPDTDYWLNVPDADNEKRYTCNGVLAIESTPANILSKLLASMDGRALYSQGTWKVFAGMPSTPAVTIDESWLNGGIQFQVGSNKNDKINTVTGTFVNPLDHWASTGFPTVQIPAYLTEDGDEELSEDMPLEFVSSGYQAQRLARISIERSRRGMKVTYPCNWQALAIAPNDVVYVNNDLLGWTNQQFRVLDWSVSITGGINLTLGEEDPEIYEIDVTNLNPIPLPDLTTLPSPWVVPAPSNLTATEALYATNVASVIKCRVTLSWTQASSGVSYFEVEKYNGVDWVFAGLTADTSFDLDDEQPGVTQYRVRACNSIGAKSDYATTYYTVLGKTAPPADVTGFMAASNKGFIDLVWDNNVELDIAGYEIRLGSTWATATLLAANHASSRFSWQPDSTGNKTFLVKAIDTSGNYSTNEATATIIINAPVVSGLTQSVVDNNVLLQWTLTQATYSIAYTEIRRGLTFSTATVIGRVNGTFTTIFEPASSTYKYWAVAVDIAGLYGTEVGTYTVVNQPPDYVLYGQQNLAWSGTKTSCAVDGTSLLAPVNITETYQAHFTAHSWTAPQDQVTAGYTRFLQPTPATASYVEIIDFGASIAACKINLALTKSEPFGTVTITPTISVSADNVTYTDYAGVYEAFGTSFRYVKITLNFATSDSGIVVISQATVRLDKKLKTVHGVCAAVSSDSGGTSVDITGQFIDVQAITVSPAGTTAAIAIYDFTDVPNPKSFKILLFNTSGTRISGNVSYTVRGV